MKAWVGQSCDGDASSVASSVLSFWKRTEPCGAAQGEEKPRSQIRISCEYKAQRASIMLGLLARVNVD